MKNKIEAAISEFQSLWDGLSMESIHKIKSTMAALAKNEEAQNYFQAEAHDPQKGLELHRDQTKGFILLAYSEPQGTYRIPHNHGSAWVIYAVVSGEVEMGSYFNATRIDGSDHLVLKNRENLVAGNIRIYFPGEIHDTRCLSKNAVILRLTSLDLKEEERAGRMKRYQYGG